MKKFTMFIREIKHLPRMFLDFGWGNGYVVIPEGSPLHGKNYREIPVYVHGGLTFSNNRDELDWEEIPEGSEGTWIVGFDTAHAMDTLEKCPMDMVFEETKRLMEQLIKLDWKLQQKKTAAGFK